MSTNAKAVMMIFAGLVLLPTYNLNPFAMFTPTQADSAEITQTIEPPNLVPAVSEVSPEQVNTDKQGIAKEEEAYKKENEPKEEVKPVTGIPVTEAPKPQPQPGKTPIEKGVFARGQTGQYLIDYVRGNPNGAKLYSAFEARYGERVAKKAAISLYYENGSLWELTTGVCSAKFQIGGDYRNCNFADLNSAGFDAGLKQINTWYQRKRIAKLGGPDCTPSNSRDRSDACTKSQIQWLHNIDNNVAIALDIYGESGFGPWYGAQKAKVDSYA